jgi:hypothetical protein
VLDTICLIVDKEENDYGDVTWKFVKGCFQNGSPARYRKAKPNQYYFFDDIRIEVRDFMDPFLSAVEVSKDEVNLPITYQIFAILAALCFIDAVVCAVMVYLRLKEIKSGEGNYASQVDDQNAVDYNA